MSLLVGRSIDLAGARDLLRIVRNGRDVGRGSAQLLAALCLVAHVVIAGCCCRHSDPALGARAGAASETMEYLVVVKGIVESPPGAEDVRSLHVRGTVHVVAGAVRRTVELHPDWSFSFLASPTEDITLVVDGNQHVQLSRSAQPGDGFIGIAHIGKPQIPPQPYHIATHRKWILGVRVTADGHAPDSGPNRDLLVQASPAWSNGLLQAELIDVIEKKGSTDHYFAGWPDTWEFRLLVRTGEAERLVETRIHTIAKEPRDYVTFDVAK